MLLTWKNRACLGSNSPRSKEHLQGEHYRAAAWQMYQRLSEPRRQRAAARAARKERRRAEEAERRIRLEDSKRTGEEQEIHKAQLRQARAYNSQFWF